MIGWHAENFARAGKNLKNLADYLKAPSDDDPEAGAWAMRAMIDRLRQKKEAGNGAG